MRKHGEHRVVLQIRFPSASPLTAETETDSSVVTAVAISNISLSRCAILSGLSQQMVFPLRIPTQISHSWPNASVGTSEGANWLIG